VELAAGSAVASLCGALENWWTRGGQDETSTAPTKVLVGMVLFLGHQW
jgi:hypothetical protein